MGKYAQGDHVFVNISNCYVREAEILKYTSGFYTIRFTDTSSTGGTRVRENRLFASREEAEQHIGGAKLKSGIETKKAYWRN